MLFRVLAILILSHLSVSIALSSEVQTLNTPFFQIIKSCGDQYQYENQGFFDGIFKSSRTLTNQMMSINEISATKDQSLINTPVWNEYLNSINALSATPEMERTFLKRVSDLSLENSINSLLLFNAIYNKNGLLESPVLLNQFKSELAKDVPLVNLYSTKIDSIINKTKQELKSQKVKFHTRIEIQNIYKKLGHDINQACFEINKDANKFAGPPPTRGGAYKRTKIFRSYARRNDINNKINQVLINFSQEHKEISFLLYSDRFRDIFPFEENIGAECSRGDELEPINTRIIADLNIRRGMTDIKKELLKDFETSLKNLSILNKNIASDIAEQNTEVIKYKPYLIQKLIENEPFLINKEFYSKYTCQQIFNIFNSDETWNKVTLSGGVFLGVLTGGIPAFFGTGMIPLLISGATLATEGAILYSVESTDATSIMNASTIGKMNHQIDHKQFLENETLAEDKKSTALLAVGTVAAGGISHTVAPGIKVIGLATKTKVQKIKQVRLEKRQLKARQRSEAKELIKGEMWENMDNLEQEIFKIRINAKRYSHLIEIPTNKRTQEQIDFITVMKPKIESKSYLEEISVKSAKRRKIKDALWSIDSDEPAHVTARIKDILKNGAPDELIKVRDRAEEIAAKNLEIDQRNRHIYPDRVNKGPSIHTPQYDRFYNNKN